MKTRQALLLCALVAGCVDAPSSSSTREQAICNPDLDTCPGGHPLRDAETHTNSVAYQKEKLAGATSPTPHASCYTDDGHAICTAGDWISATTYVSTQCDIALDGSGASCSSIKCTDDGCQAI